MRNVALRTNALAAEEDSLLASLEQRIIDSFGLHPVMATEIEFYLLGSDAGYPESVLHDINHALADAGIVAHPVEKERAPEQYEIALEPMQGAVKLAQHTRALKQIVAEVATSNRIQADFSAKPFAHLAGSGLHLHLHLQDTDGRNHYTRSEDDVYSTPLLNSIGGMLETMGDCMVLFAPLAASYTRFKAGENAPTTASWGPNNRTTAIRLPNKAKDQKHIEHRVSGADAEPALALAGVLLGVHWGLTERLQPWDATFGDASKPMYDLPQLPTDFDTALDQFRFSDIIPKYLSRTVHEQLIRRALMPEAF